MDMIYPLPDLMPVTPSNTSNVVNDDGDDIIGRGVIVGGAGVLDYTSALGKRRQVTLAAGIIHNLEVKKVWADETTATLILVGKDK